MPVASLSALALAGAALLGSSSSQPARPPSSPPAPQVTAAQAATSVAGTSAMIVFVDPETGGLTSTPPTPEAAAELLALENALSRSSESLVTTQATDGSPMIDLQGRFQSVTLAGASATGAHRAQALCTTSRRTARAVIAPASSPATPISFGREER